MLFSSELIRECLHKKRGFMVVGGTNIAGGQLCKRGKSQEQAE